MSGKPGPEADTPKEPDNACAKGTCGHPEHEQGTVIQ